MGVIMSKPTLRLKFHNFWENFNPSLMPQDYFLEFILSHGYNVVLVDNDPDIVVSSLFGKPVSKSDFNGDPFIINYNYEPDWLYPDRNAGYSDLKIGHGEGYIRVPLWMMYTIWDQTNLNTVYKLKDDPFVGQGCHHTPGFGLKIDNGYKNNPLFISNILTRHEQPIKIKDKFCNFTYTKAIPNRVNFFQFLNEYKFVHSTGSVMNNVNGYRMISKSRELSEYKFTIAFENSIYPGYVTEKIFEPLVAGSVPIYFGDESCLMDFNEKAFIYANRFKTYGELRDYVIEVDNNDELYQSYLKEPIFGSNQENVLNRCKNLFEEIYDKLTTKKPSLRI